MYLKTKDNFAKPYVKDFDKIMQSHESKSFHLFNVPYDDANVEEPLFKISLSTQLPAQTILDNDNDLRPKTDEASNLTTPDESASSTEQRVTEQQATQQQTTEQQVSGEKENQTYLSPYTLYSGFPSLSPDGEIAAQFGLTQSFSEFFDFDTVYVEFQSEGDRTISLGEDDNDPVEFQNVDPQINNMLSPQNLEDAQTISAIDITNGFFDVNQGDTLIYSASGLPAGLTIDATTGIISGIIDNRASEGGTEGNTNGVYAVTIFADDGNGGIHAQQTVVFTVTNPPPVAKNDQLTAISGSPLTVNLFDDNGNGPDVDPNNDPLRITHINNTSVSIGDTITLPSGARLTIGDDGNIIYTPQAGETVTFTGDASADFQGFDNQITVTDDNDVGLPPFFPFPFSGWDINNVHFVYDQINDDLYVGIDTFGIFGDADGDGNPGAPSLDLIIRGGTDFADLGQSEVFHLFIDLTDDNTLNPEFVIGVQSGDDITDFGLYEVSVFNGLSTTYGAQIVGGSTLFANPDASNPDLEFILNDLFLNLGLDIGDGDTFETYIITGSFQDDGIGEDEIANGPQTVEIDFGLDAAGEDKFTYTISDSAGLTDTATVHIDIV